MSNSPLIAAMQKNTNKTTTTNGAKAFKSTLDSAVDFFYSAAASRGKDVTGMFASVYADDKDVAVRLALWLRDVRGGAGERQNYRNILKYLASNDWSVAVQLINKTVEVGRWDDLLCLVDTPAQAAAFDAIKVALNAGDALCAKWMPRKGEVAAKLRKHFDWTPKFYRKTLVALSNTVETAMCANKWDEIDYSKLPSVASARYQKAFGRHDTAGYVAYLNALQKGETTINAGAVYPYDVLKSVELGNALVADQQWKALPDYVGLGSFLCMVDVSGSMCCPAGGNRQLTCLDVAVSLGLYCAERCKGAFKDTFLTFSSVPELVTLSGPLSTRYNTMSRADWAMSTDIEKAFSLVLSSALKYGVAPEDMPSSIIILSDMQFDRCVDGKSGLGMIRKRYAEAGYEVPQIVFWNLNASGNVPAKANAEGVALVSGFSPSLMNSVLGSSFDTPLDTMMKVIMVPRYDWQ